MFNQPGQGQYHTGASGQTYHPSAAASQPQVYVPGGVQSSQSVIHPTAAASSAGTTSSSWYPSAPTAPTNTYMPAASSTYQPTSSAMPSFSQALSVPPPPAAPTCYSSFGPTAPQATYLPAASASTYMPAVASSASAQQPKKNSAMPTSIAQALSAVAGALPAKYASSLSSATGVPASGTAQSYGNPSAPPTHQYTQPTTQASYYDVGTKPGDYSAVSYTTATPVGTMYAPSATNSAVYKGGPTNGIVSEGNPTRCHKVDYEIKGHELQLVEIELDSNETVIAEAGALMFLEEGISFEAKFGDGSTPKPGFFNQLLSAGGRLLTGESLFLTHFTNNGQRKARVAFAAPYPGNIIPVNMETTGGRLICEKDAFLCAALGTKVAIHFNKKLGSGFFGGEGFILQRLEGDGMAFLHAGGTVIRRELTNERLRIDTGCVVAFTEGINFDIQLVPGLKSIIFGGEGIFLATLEGTGTVWMQSLPLSRFADKIVRSAPAIGGRRQGETDFVASAAGALMKR